MIFLSRRVLVGNLSLALAYVAMGQLGVVFSIPGLSISPVWLPVGINLAALRLWGPTLLPGVWLGAAATHLLIGHGIPVAAGIALGTTASAWLGGALLKRWQPEFIPDTARGPLVLLAVVYLAGLLAAAWGVGVLLLGGSLASQAATDTLLTWWLGDAIGMLLLTPLLLASWELASRRGSLPHPLQVSLALVLLLGLAWASFVERIQFTTALGDHAYIGIPLLAWLCLRAHPAVPLAANVALVQILIAGQALHAPPVQTLGAMLALHVELLVTTLTVLILAAMATGLRESRRQMRDGEVLRHRESVFSRAMLEALSDAGVGILLIENQRITFATRALIDMTGYSGEELGDLPSYQELIAPEDRARVAANQRRRLAGEDIPPRYDIRARRKDGSLFDVELAVAVLPGENGPALLSALIDVSARKAAEAELRASEGQLRTLAEANFEGILIHENGKVLLANRRLADLLGYEPDQVIGRNLLDYIPPGSVAEVAGYINSGNSVETYELLVRHADGSEIPVEVTARPAVFQGRTVRVAAVRDIRAWKAVRAELIASRDQAVRAHQAEALFFANMSHELRTPLHAVIGFAGLGLEQCPPDQPELARYFERIRASGERQLSLVNDLLDLVRLEVGKTAVCFADHDVAEVARAVADELAPLWSARRIRMVVDAPAADARATTAECDREMIAQVLRNLLSNAIKFSPEGHAVVLAVVPEQNAGAAATLRITVRDEGIGIPPDELDSIFEKFTQSSRTRNGAGGTGLGLAICREIMNAHGGSIGAANNPGAGALFTCRLPRRQAHPLNPGKELS